MRLPARNRRPVMQEIEQAFALPAPVGGWNTQVSQAAMDPRYAIYMDNWWPTARSVQIRKGATNWVTGLGSVPIKSLMTWEGLTSSKLFAATDAGVYDVTSSGTFGAVSTAVTNGRLEYVNFRTSGGSFLVCVNGTDELRYFNGTVWATVANFSISGGGTLNTTDISFIQSFKRGLYFIKKDSMSFFYLPIDQITGTVSEFPLGALFSKGGKIVAMGTWTVDGGAGVDDLFAVVSSKGQIAIYKGTDPSSASTWAVVGVYDLGEPLGPRCFAKLGGDLIYLSNYGCAGLSRALQSTKVGLDPSISNTIAEAFGDASASYGENEGWQLVFHPNHNLFIANIPVNSYNTSHQYVMNTETGAWARFIGWDAYCFVVYNKTLYMGMTGKVAKAWQDGGDFDGLINCYVKQAPTYLSPRARMKKVDQLQPIFKLGGKVAVDIAIDSDFEDLTTYNPAVFSSVANSRFDAAIFDTAVWGELAKNKIDWVTVTDKMGYTKALRLRVLAQDATVEWSATNLLYKAGALQG